jgi:hypothetical protein
MRKLDTLLFIFLIQILLIHLCCGQNIVRISGYIRDTNSGEPLIGTNLWLVQQMRGTASNTDGYFNIITDKTYSDTLIISYIGYQSLAISLPKTDTFMVFFLKESATLDEVTIYGDNTQEVREQFGVTTLSAKQIKQITPLLGEADVMRALQLTPGVQGGAEGTTGLFVRGGSPGQNLILLDGTTVYNTAHLFGFISVFNPDAVKNASLIRDGFPARYGGRLSSVVDVTMKDGNREKHQREFSLGLISSRYLMEGPLKDKKTSYLVSTRTSYLSLLMLPLYLRYKNQQTDELTTYWMYDVNLKITHEINAREKLSLSFFNGYDTWGLTTRISDDQSLTRLNWGNATAALRYTNAIGAKAFFQSVFNFNQYRYNYIARIEENNQETQFLNSSKIRDWAGHTYLDWKISDLFSLQTGFDLANQRLRPNFNQFNGAFEELGLVDTLEIPNTFLNNVGIYLSQQFQPLAGLIVETGLRMSNYFLATENYSYFEPRLKLSYNWQNNAQSIQLSWTRMSQPLHLLSTNGAGLPNDIWTPPTDGYAPELSQQFGLGYRWKSWDALWEGGIEAYHKVMTNLVDYQRGLDYYEVSGRPWQTLVVGEGKGEAYGIEGSIRKNIGRINGWLTYTWSRSSRQTPGINNGAWYPFRYDRRHDLAMVLNYQINSAWKLSTTFEYQTGFAITMPVGIQQTLQVDQSSYPSFIFAGRNNARMPKYHRLDFGFSHTKMSRKGNENIISLGVYNAYGRQNPFYIDYKVKNPLSAGNTTGGYFFQRTLFGFLPYLTWSVKM